MKKLKDFKKICLMMAAILVVFGGFVFTADAAEIHGTKWDDANGNAVMDIGELGVPSISICYHSYGTIPYPGICILTDDNGDYSITGLSNGTYQIYEIAPAGKVQTYPTYCPVTSNCTAIYGNGWHAVTVTDSDIIFGKNFGNSAASEIQGTKFNDTNGNAVKDAGESGIPGISISLKRILGLDEVYYGWTTTDSNGNYNFTHLTAGIYKVEEDAVHGSVQTYPAGGSPHMIALGVGETISDVDFGNNQVPPGTIQGMKFNDTNGNGLHDIGEGGIEGVTITLASAGRTTTTDFNGNYIFNNVPVGPYTIFETSMTGYTATTPTYLNVVVSSGLITIADFGNRRLIPPPSDVSIAQQSGSQDGVPTVLRPALTVLTIRKDLSSISNVAGVNLTMEWSSGFTLTGEMTNDSSGLWSIDFSPPFPPGSAQMTFKVDVNPPGDWPGSGDMIQIGDIIFIDPSGKIINACTDEPIEDATVTLLKEFEPNTGTFFTSPVGHLYQYPDINPLTTLSDGEYRWDVNIDDASGTYKVRAEKTGYTPNESEQVEIPPPRTELDIFLTPIGGCDSDGPVTMDVISIPNPVEINNDVILNALVDDTTTGVSDIVSAEYTLDSGINWNSIDAQDGLFDSPTEGVTATFSIADSNVYNLCVRGTDAAGNTGLEQCNLLVVFDPKGMAAGGGWYYPLDDSENTLPGTASFGFITKIKDRSATGNLEFQYHVEDKLNLKSTSITWLVVSGSNAQFKGTATLNGEPGYYFRVMAKDNGEPGVGSDWFSIKIWNGDPDIGGSTLIHSSHNILAGGNIKVKTK